MLSHGQICAAIEQVAEEYALTKAHYFGSYADGCATECSDLDLLVEFDQEAVSLLRIIGLKYRLQEMLNIDVDVIHAPVPKDSILDINETVVAYESEVIAKLIITSAPAVPPPPPIPSDTPSRSCGFSA
jgi:predicted nucleotidyltransferase